MKNSSLVVPEPGTTNELVDKPGAKLKESYKLRSVLLGAALPVGLLLFWQYAVSSGLWPRSIMAAPSEVVSAIVRLSTNGELLAHSLASLKRLFAGFVLGAAAGALLGISAGTSKSIDAIISPTVKVLSPIPPISWIPLLIILLGIGEFSKISLIGIGSFFVLFIHSFDGVRSTDKRYLEVALSLEKPWPSIVKKIIIPSSFPSILIGARVALSLSWILLIAAEVIAASKGLGWFIWDSRNFSRPDEMIAGMITVGILGAATDFLLWIIGRLMLRWRDDFRGL